jgi:hypothetical protein
LLVLIYAGQDIQGDLLGIAVGHLYFYWADVWPKLAAKHGWAWKRLIVTPRMLYWLMGLLPAVEAREERMRVDDERREQRLAAEAAAGAATTQTDGQDSSQLSAIVEAEEMELAAALAAIAELEARSSEPEQADSEPEPSSSEPAHADSEPPLEEASRASEAGPVVAPAVSEDSSIAAPAPAPTAVSEDSAIAARAPAPTAEANTAAEIASDAEPVMTAAEIRRRRAARFGMSDE